MKTIGITGISGFIGSHFADLCLERGHKVIGLERRKSANPDYLVSKPFSNLEIVYGDIKDAEVVNYFVGLCDGVINLAGLLGTSEQVSTPHDSVDANIKGAINFYEAIRRHKLPAVQITVGNYTWFNTYAITKYCAERFAIMYNQEFGTKIAVVRGLNVYGPMQKHKPVRKVVPNFIRNALLNEPITVFGDGGQQLDLIYVRDTVELLYKALINNHKCFNNVMEAGSGQPVTCLALAEEIIKLSGSQSKIQFMPMRSGEPVNSITKADVYTLEPLGKFEFTGLGEGLKKTIDWYKENKGCLGI